ncbi:aldo/keto reductase [Desertivibrio insolitus]|uniref:aldo/keto reductase n=1 Tax=Herbiconiux sp. SYSU D00978 TaxID=2812562 RepID=UPI001A973476|nr:aldo/keto reductase [Herbiconiux sp. SYSU D00978]
MTASIRDVHERRRLGTDGPEVTGIGIGGSPLGGGRMRDLYGHDTAASDAVDTVLAVLEGPFNFLDTSNNYSEGESERRIGEAIARRGGLPEGFVLATKVDGDPSRGDFSAARVRDSIAESIDRLGVDRFPLVHLHDPEHFLDVETALTEDGPARAVVELKEQGVAASIGIAGGTVSEMLGYVRSGLFDVLLTHNRYTLLDRSARPLLEEARERGMGVLNAAPFGGGILAKGPSVLDRYAYGMGSPEQLDAARRMERACLARDVPLAAAALQFSTRDALVDSTIVGVSNPRRLQELERYASIEVPDDLWDELERLTPPEESWIRD